MPTPRPKALLINFRTAHQCIKSLTMMLFMLSPTVPTVSANECFPDIDHSQPQYVVGYGSLLYDESRKSHQLKSTPQTPVWVSGFKRGWLTRTRPDGIRNTQLGIVPDPAEHFNAALIPMEVRQVTSLDREQTLFCRVPVSIKKLAPMTKTKLPQNGQIWLYQTKAKHVSRPAGDYPIVMSFVDEFLTGCTQLAKQFKLPAFASYCVSSTQNWSTHWVNDRQRPLTKRPIQVDKQAVDKLLETLEDNLYEKIRAE